MQPIIPCGTHHDLARTLFRDDSGRAPEPWEDEPRLLAPLQPSRLVRVVHALRRAFTAPAHGRRTVPATSAFTDRAE